MRLSLKNKILLLIASTVTGLAAIILVALSSLTGREIESTVRSDVNAAGGVVPFIGQGGRPELHRCKRATPE